MWQHFHHEADVGVRGSGSTLEQAFEQAAIAMMAVITNPDTIACHETVRLECTAPDRELLLVDWLNALIYEMATRHMLFRDFHVETDDQQLHATACGEAIDIARHQPATEIKGATYTALEVREDTPGTWLAQCVVDV